MSDGVLVIEIGDDGTKARLVPNPKVRGLRRRNPLAKRIRRAFRKRNIAGYKDEFGVFHPIRWDPDYDPEEVGEDRDYATNQSMPAEKVRFYMKRSKGALRSPAKRAARRASRRTASRRTRRKKSRR